jgi:ribosomal protein L44E
MANGSRGQSRYRHSPLKLAPHKRKGKEVEINFECQKCKNIFDCEVGRVSIDEITMRPVFEKKLVCPRCGELTMNGVDRTETGQGQLTEVTMNI